MANKYLSQDLQGLDLQLRELLALCQRLRDENNSLRQQQTQLVTERAGLIEKNEMARSRVEAMIGRLKTMENNA
ncbi:MAG: TIGR02449 family protein [Gammaproteobacteria bacterium]|nr:TIGR02449 family protein [Gammaproteobacteria bacterium]